MEKHHIFEIIENTNYSKSTFHVFTVTACTNICTITHEVSVSVVEVICECGTGI